MTLVPNCYITVGDYEFDYVHQVHIESSWKSLTDTATISLPRNLRLKEKSLDKVFKIGDVVDIQLGYNGRLVSEFKGFVARSPEPNIPFVLHCEDNMWLLKKGLHSKSWAKATLKEVLEAIMPKGIKVDAVDAELGAFRLHQATPAKVLAKLKETYGLVSYFKGDTLHVGKVYTTSSNEVRYHFQRNIISSSLEYKRKEEVSFRVRAISMLPNNKKVEVTVPEEKSGAELGSMEEHTLHFYNVASKDALKKLAEAELSKMHYDGFRGSFDAFGEPYCTHGDIASLTDDIYPERSGRYFIDKVAIGYGVDGYRRKVELGPRA